MPAKICAVVPSIRPEQMAKFREAWQPLFEKHEVTLITVWDGENPHVELGMDSLPADEVSALADAWRDQRDLFCRHTDACRNLGFVAAAQLKPDYILTMDDDVAPCAADIEYKPHPSYPSSTMRWSCTDPIQAHLDALARRVPLSWMNTAHDTDLYLRGVPYGIREEAPVMLSHGVWVGTPDFDGETQLKLEQGSGIPYSLPYYVGPIPRGVQFPLCGMNVMIRREALPYFYFAPMGPDSGVENLHRMADIWMGIFLKRQFDSLGWACVTGYSTVLHTRASNAKKNFEQEKLGREWNEKMWRLNIFGFRQGDPMAKYIDAYADKRDRYAKLIRSIMGGQS